MNVLDLERLDLPSASSARRRRCCVGSENLIAELRRVGKLSVPESTPDARAGSAMHAAWAGQEINLTPDSERTVEDLVTLERMVLKDWAGDDPVYLIGREQRLWLHEGFRPVLSGQFDVAYGRDEGRSVIIMDAKTLYGEVDPAQYNDQLRELVALYYFNHPEVLNIRVAILAPRQAERVSLADYSTFEMELALRLMQWTLDEAANPEAVRTPGNYCFHCPAVDHCEEARQLIGRTGKVAELIEAGRYDLPLGEKGAAYLENMKTVRGLLDKLEAAYKDKLADQPDAIPGWRLREGNKVRKIADPAEALHVAKNNWFKESDFWECVDVSVVRLRDKLGTVASIKRGLDKKFDEVFGPLISYKQNAPILEKIRSKKGELTDGDHRLADTE